VPTEADLFDPQAHEPLTATPWDAERARSAIRTIVADTEAAFSTDTLWPAHALDEEPDEPPLHAPCAIYLGASGVIWALDALARKGAAGTARDWAAVAATLPGRYRAQPDFPLEGVLPSLTLGESGILVVAHGLAAGRGHEERLLELVRGNARNPTLEILWGAPGTMLAAHVMLQRTGDPVWADAWRESADEVWAAWDGDVWCQEMGGKRSHVLGAGHGFVSNVYVLARGDLLDDARRAELERRTVDVVSRYVRRGDGLAQWPETLEWPYPGRPIEVRTQWCHGAPGLVTALATLAPGNDELTEILVAAGELTWRAGPHGKGPGLCHGTAGNGYAFLKLLERTGDEIWLARSRAFAMHAIEQAERMAAEHGGRRRHSLWTGDPGVAVYLQGCLDVDAAMPTLDAW
jgi:hypothetical protein